MKPKNKKQIMNQGSRVRSLACTLLRAELCVCRVLRNQILHQNLKLLKPLEIPEVLAALRHLGNAFCLFVSTVVEEEEVFLSI